MNILALRKRVFIGAALLLASGMAHADGSAALQRFLDNVDGLQAQFSQTQSDEQGKALQSSSGQMWLQRSQGKGSGRFRWDYAKPYQQQIVCDGQRVWLYDPDLAQVTVRPAAEALNGTPAAALLSQRGTLRDSFEVKDAGSEGKLQKVRLTPKAADTEFRSVEIWFDGELPVRLRFQDPLGGSTDIALSALERNPKMKSGLFDFTPPKGVEVVDAGGK